MTTYYTDGDGRHLICVPYTREGLHAMARDLGIKRCWFHNGGGGRFLHYDVPKRLVGRLPAKVQVVSSRQLLALMKGSKCEPQR